MAYGQPTFGVILNSEETPERVAFGYNLIMATHQIQTTTKNLTTMEERSHTYEKTYKCDVIEVLEVDRKYKKSAMKQGFRLLEEGEYTIVLSPPILDLDAQLTYRRKPVPILSRKNLAKISINCFADAAAAANYFGDRLPKAFYDKYLGFAIEEIN